MIPSGRLSRRPLSFWGAGTINLLQLVQRAKRETSISGAVPTTVAAVTGEIQRLVDWVIESYKDIIKRHDEWHFLRSEFSVNTIASQRQYLPSACTDTVLSAAIGSATVGDLREWIEDSFFIYLTSAGVSAQRFFLPMDYEQFRDTYMLGTAAEQEPAVWTIRPRDDALLVGPLPSAVSTITGEYWRRAPVLALDADLPLFHADYHMGIVWRAVWYYAAFNEDGGLLSFAGNEFEKVRAELEKKYLPQIGIAGPLL